MPIRILEPPKTIQVEKPDGEVEPMTFAAFVRSLLNQPAWVRDYDHVRAACEIDAALGESTGGAVELAEESWRKLEAVARTPDERVGYGLQPWAMRQLVPYLTAIVEAKER